MVELRVRERRLRVPIWVMPGQAPHSITLQLGYGRRRAGHVGDGQGFNAYSLRTSTDPYVETGLQILKTGDHYDFAGTQHHFNMEHRNLVRVGTLDEYLRRSELRHRRGSLSRHSAEPIPRVSTRRIRVGHEHRSGCLHRLQGVHDRMPGGEQHSGGRQRSGPARSRDALDSRRSLLRGRCEQSAHLLSASALHDV